MLLPADLREGLAADPIVPVMIESVGSLDLKAMGFRRFSRRGLANVSTEWTFSQIHDQPCRKYCP
ncbi:MAG: hypothetical protein HUU04_04660 [Verrucomicrobiae bacterium]|nr:hypothetical protein [Verrucomicrobiae bacterium]